MIIGISLIEQRRWWYEGAIHRDDVTPLVSRDFRVDVDGRCGAGLCADEVLGVVAQAIYGDGTLPRWLRTEAEWGALPSDGMEPDGETVTQIWKVELVPNIDDRGGKWCVLHNWHLSGALEDSEALWCVAHMIREGRPHHWMTDPVKLTHSPPMKEISA